MAAPNAADLAALLDTMVANMAGQEDEETVSFLFLKLIHTVATTQGADDIAAVAMILDICVQCSSQDVVERDIERLQLPPRPELIVAITKGVQEAARVLRGVVIYHSNTDRDTTGEHNGWKIRGLCVMTNVKVFRDTYLRDTDSSSFLTFLRALEEHDRARPAAGGAKAKAKASGKTRAQPKAAHPPQPPGTADQPPSHEELTLRRVGRIVENNNLPDITRVAMITSISLVPFEEVPSANMACVVAEGHEMDVNASGFSWLWRQIELMMSYERQTAEASRFFYLMLSAVLYYFFARMEIQIPTDGRPSGAFIRQLSNNLEIKLRELLITVEEQDAMRVARIPLERLIFSPGRTALFRADAEGEEVPVQGNHVDLTTTTIPAPPDNQEMCSICLNVMNKGILTVLQACNHTFHTDCIIGWFRRSLHGGCPLCRDRGDQPPQRQVEQPVINQAQPEVPQEHPDIQDAQQQTDNQDEDPEIETQQQTESQDEQLANQDEDPEIMHLAPRDVLDGSGNNTERTFYTISDDLDDIQLPDDM